MQEQIYWFQICNRFSELKDMMKTPQIKKMPVFLPQKILYETELFSFST